MIEDAGRRKASIFEAAAIFGVNPSDIGGMLPQKWIDLELLRRVSDLPEAETERRIAKVDAAGIFQSKVKFRHEDIFRAGELLVENRIRSASASAPAVTS